MLILTRDITWIGTETVWMCSWPFNATQTVHHVCSRRPTWVLQYPCMWPACWCYWTRPLILQPPWHCCNYSRPTRRPEGRTPTQIVGKNGIVRICIANLLCSLMWLQNHNQTIINNRGGDTTIKAPTLSGVMMLLFDHIPIAERLKVMPGCFSDGEDYSTPTYFNNHSIGLRTDTR